MYHLDRIITPEQEFVNELNNYLEMPLSKHGVSKVKTMLLNYRSKNPLLKIVKEADPKIVATMLQRRINVRKVIEAKDILRIVGEYLEIPPSKFLVKRRSVELVYARYLCMFFLRRFTKMSLKGIGKTILGKDHTTVIHGCASLKDRIKNEEPVRIDVENINAKIIAFRKTLDLES